MKPGTMHDAHEVGGSMLRPPPLDTPALDTPPLDQQFCGNAGRTGDPGVCATSPACVEVAARPVVSRPRVRRRLFAASSCV
jgi:hypothetical protein